MPTLSGFMTVILVLSAYCEHSKNPDRKVRVFFSSVLFAPVSFGTGAFLCLFVLGCGYHA